FVRPLDPGSVRVPLRPPVRFPGVEVGVEMEEAYALRSRRPIGPENRQADRMVSAGHERDDARAEQRLQARLDPLERVLRVPADRIDVAVAHEFEDAQRL